MTNKRFAMRRGGGQERPRRRQKGEGQLLLIRVIRIKQKKTAWDVGLSFFSCMLGERATGLIILLRCGSGFVG